MRKISKLNIIAQNVIIQNMNKILFSKHNPDSGPYKNPHSKNNQHWNDYLPFIHDSNIYRHNQNHFFGLPSLTAIVPAR